jgi:tRNA(Leu) C34 or U34 (ribose-2'-O)-methylase TrmL
MCPPVESLNVAVATAILIYAARRQRLPGTGASVRQPANAGGGNTNPVHARDLRQ